MFSIFQVDMILTIMILQVSSGRDDQIKLFVKKFDKLMRERGIILGIDVEEEGSVSLSTIKSTEEIPLPSESVLVDKRESSTGLVIIEPSEVLKQTTESFISASSR